MSKIKKVLALVLAMAMVMAMSIVSFAETGTASITVSGLTPNDNTNLKIYEIVSFNAAQSKWDIATWAKDYVTDTTNPYKFDWAALKNIAPTQEPVVTNESSYTFNNLGIGAYLIIASGNTTTYQVMGAATYEYDTDKLIGPNAVTISAKGEGYTVNKAYNENSLVKDFAKLGDTITFDITTVFPSYPDGDTNRSFTITDTPVGMKVTGVTVYVNNSQVTEKTDYTVTQLNVADQAVTVSFTSEYIGSKNVHAGQSVKVVVNAVVTDEDTFTNSATSNKNKSSEPTTVTGDVGSITITKVDKDKNTLKGAKFEIKRDSDTTALQFVKIADGEYWLKTEDVAGDAVTEVEATNGTVVLKGLGAGTYHITETVAPEGYSINGKIDDVTLTVGTEAEEAVHDGSREVVDTKLSALPSTGGIGTTIFTVVGCLIMIAAAAMFFVSRRRTEK